MDRFIGKSLDVQMQNNPKILEIIPFDEKIKALQEQMSSLIQQLERLCAQSRINIEELLRISKCSFIELPVVEHEVPSNAREQELAQSRQLALELTTRSPMKRLVIFPPKQSDIPPRASYMKIKCDQMRNHLLQEICNPGPSILSRFIFHARDGAPIRETERRLIESLFKGAIEERCLSFSREHMSEDEYQRVMKEMLAINQAIFDWKYPIDLSNYKWGSGASFSLKGLASACHVCAFLIPSREETTNSLSWKQGACSFVFVEITYAGKRWVIVRDPVNALGTAKSSDDQTLAARYSVIKAQHEASVCQSADSAHSYFNQCQRGALTSTSEVISSANRSEGVTPAGDVFS